MFVKVLLRAIHLLALGLVSHLSNWVLAVCVGVLVYIVQTKRPEWHVANSLASNLSRTGFDSYCDDCTRKINSVVCYTAWLSSSSGMDRIGYQVLPAQGDKPCQPEERQCSTSWNYRMLVSPQSTEGKKKTQYSTGGVLQRDIAMTLVRMREIF